MTAQIWRRRWEFNRFYTSDFPNRNTSYRVLSPNDPQWTRQLKSGNRLCSQRTMSELYPIKLYLDIACIAVHSDLRTYGGGTSKPFRAIATRTRDRHEEKPIRATTVRVRYLLQKQCLLKLSTRTQVMRQTRIHSVQLLAALNSNCCLLKTSSNCTCTGDTGQRN